MAGEFKLHSFLTLELTNSFIPPLKWKVYYSETQAGRREGAPTFYFTVSLLRSCDRVK